LPRLAAALTVLGVSGCGIGGLQQLFYEEITILSRISGYSPDALRSAWRSGTRSDPTNGIVQGGRNWEMFYFDDAGLDSTAQFYVRTLGPDRRPVSE
jgi:hypothetical protein